MKVRTKLSLLLVGVFALFIGGVLALRAHDREKFRKLAAEREEACRRSFDDFLAHWSESLEIFGNYFTCDDKMAAAVMRGDREWAETNLREDTLASYRGHIVWAYNTAGALVFQRNILYSEALPEVPLPPGQIQPLLDGPRHCHFFTQTPLGLMEIRGATIHPSKDAGRITPPMGYFFAARRWTREDLKEMSLFTGNEIRILPPGDAEAEPASEAQGQTVSFSRVLPGWDGLPVAVLSVRNESAIVAQLNRSSGRLFWTLLVFAFFLFLALVISLTRWVNRPLDRLSKSLKTQDLARISRLQNEGSEFGDVARLIRAFFQQRDDLMREMNDRQQAETALQESEERLRHSQKMEAIGRLAGGIAHDFNNLLTAIIGYAELISMRTSDEESRQEATQIRKAGEQAAHLTRQLLAFSRKQILQPRVLDLNMLVHEMEKLLQRVIGEQIDLRVEPRAANGRVRADPTQLEQVILNLGVNARDAMPRGGVLTMRTGNFTVPQSALDSAARVPPGRYVTLAVQDTGCGMDAATRERIFEPFFTTKGPGKGTGLGLATVYGIVRQSGGQITVDSQPGAGATFTIFLPEEEAPIDVPREAPASPAKSQRTETVLVVEDEEIVRELVCAVLEEQGYKVLCAEGGSEGLRIAREHRDPIELLVTDIIMPQMNGPEVARQFLQIRPETKVLFVSGYSDNDISEQGVLAPDVRFLEKPFTPEALGRKVREVLGEDAAIAR